jgi:hypothetical protein
VLKNAQIIETPKIKSRVYQGKKKGIDCPDETVKGKLSELSDPLIKVSSSAKVKPTEKPTKTPRVHDENTRMSAS